MHMTQWIPQQFASDHPGFAFQNSSVCRLLVEGMCTVYHDLVSNATYGHYGVPRFWVQLPPVVVAFFFEGAACFCLVLLNLKAQGSFSKDDLKNLSCLSGFYHDEHRMSHSTCFQLKIKIGTSSDVC